MVSPSAGASSTRTNYPILEASLETYTRWVRVGDSEAMCGPRLIVTLSRPFTPGEDAVMTWVRMQDDTQLIDIVPLKDGRDFIIFERLYTKQTYAQATEECRRFQTAMLRLIPTQHDSSDTPNVQSVI